MSLQVKQLYEAEQAHQDLREFSPDINLDLMRQPGLFAYYSSLLAKAESQYDRIKHARDVLEAKLDRKYRADLSKEDPSKKVTESQVKAAITVDENMRKVEGLVRDAKEQVMHLKAVAEAFKQRRDSLMQLAFNLREEGKGQIRVMAKTGAANRDERVAALKKGLGSIVQDDGLEDPDFDIPVV
jgi:hypothetical protein